MFCPSSKPNKKGKDRKEKKISKDILKYLIFSKWLFYFTATSTVYCHNEMLWGYTFTNSSSSIFDIKREFWEKPVSYQHQVSGPAQRNQRTTMEARTGISLSQPGKSDEVRGEGVERVLSNTATRWRFGQN